MRNLPTIPFVAGFVLGLLCASAWFTNKDALSFPLTLATGKSATSTTSTPTRPADSGAVSVADQSAGLSVTVESVTVPSPGVWLAVREMQGGDLGNVLGALHVTGPRSAIVIPLLRATAPGLSYAVELYRNDSNGDFDLVADSVYVDFATGLPVVARFTAE